MNNPTTSRIRERAYDLFLKRGNAPGDATQDWLCAEHQIHDEERGHHGPARMADSSHHGKLTDSDGCDLENPT